MSGSDLSLRHLPDLSDASFSFQIPSDSADDLLHGACNDFLTGEENFLTSPVSHTSLPLSDLEPLPSPRAFLPPPKSKSLLPTTRPNIYDPSSSKIVSRVPKPTSAAYSARPRPKPVSGENITPADRVESGFGPSDGNRFILPTKNFLNGALLIDKPVAKAGEDVSRESGAPAGFPPGVDAYSQPQETPSHPSIPTPTKDDATPTAATEELPPQNFSNGVFASEPSQQQTKPAPKFESRKPLSSKATSAPKVPSAAPNKRRPANDHVDGPGDMGMRLMMYAQQLAGVLEDDGAQVPEIPADESNAGGAPRSEIRGAEDGMDIDSVGDGEVSAPLILSAPAVHQATTSENSTPLIAYAPDVQDAPTADTPGVIPPTTLSADAPHPQDTPIVDTLVLVSVPQQAVPPFHAVDSVVVLAALPAPVNADPVPTTESLQPKKNVKPKSKQTAVSAAVVKAKSTVTPKTTGVAQKPHVKSKSNPAHDHLDGPKDLHRVAHRQQVATNSMAGPISNDDGVAQAMEMVELEMGRDNADNELAIDNEIRSASVDNPDAEQMHGGTGLLMNVPRDAEDLLTISQLEPTKVQGDDTILGGDAKRDDLLMNPATEVPLTLSQLSPRKIRDDADIEHAERMVPSPMRPSAKRPSSAAAGATERSKKSKVGVHSGARVPSRSVRPGRARGGARVVSAPTQVRIRKQPVRVSQPAAVRLTAESTSAVPAGKDIRTIAASSSSGAPGVSSSTAAKHPSASMLNATVPRQSNFEAGTGDPESGGAPAKAYNIPDFKVMHAVWDAQSALRRSQLAPTVPVPIAFSTDARAKERERFDEKVREKERERAATREVQRREREVEEARQVRELRKRAIPKAHEVPEWYKEAPRKNNGTGTTGAQ